MPGPDFVIDEINGNPGYVEKFFITLGRDWLNGIERPARRKLIPNSPPGAPEPGNQGGVQMQWAVFRMDILP